MRKYTQRSITHSELREPAAQGPHHSTKTLLRSIRARRWNMSYSVLLGRRCARASRRPRLRVVNGARAGEDHLGKLDEDQVQLIDIPGVRHGDGRGRHRQRRTWA